LIRLTGDTEGFKNAAKDLGKSIASAIADALAEAFGQEGLGDLLTGWFKDLQESDPEAAKLVGGIAGGLATAYGIYQGSQGMSRGDAALSGAMSGAAFGAMFSGVGAAIGAVVGGAIGYFSGGEADPRLWLQFNNGIANFTGDSEVAAQTLEDFNQQADLALRNTVAGLYDLGAELGDVKLLKKLSNVLSLESLGDLGFGMLHGENLGQDFANFLADELPKELLARAKGPLQNAFNKLGFGEAWGKAFDEAMQYAGDAAMEYLTRVAKGILALDNAMEDLDFDSLIEEIGKSSMESFNDFMTDALGDIEFLTEKMKLAFDMASAADDAVEIAELIQQARAAEVEMLRQIKASQDSINATWDSMQRSLDLAGRHDLFKAEYYTDELVNALENLKDAGSVEGVQQYSSEVQSAIQNLIGLVDEDQWDQSLSSLLGDSWTGIQEWLRPLSEYFGIDFENYDGTVREFFDELMGLSRGETDAAYQGIFDEIEEWADALEDAAQRAADALNQVGDAAGAEGGDGKSLADIDQTIRDMDAIDSEIQNSLLAAASEQNMLMDQFIATPPVVNIEIDGTLDPLISLIDQRIQIAGGV